MLTIRNSPLPAPAVRAHALKNCLAIVCAVNRLVEAEVCQATRLRLARSQSAVLRMIDLIEQDLRPEVSARPCCRVEACEASELLADVSARVEDLAKSRQVRLRFQAGAGSLRCERDDLTEALGNVVMNAIEASSSGGTVAVAACESAEGQLFTVRDAGPGIPSHLVSRLGVPFTSSRKHGSGLGLAVARAVVEEHGGLVHIESAVGTGTVVSIWLPTNG